MANPTNLADGDLVTETWVDAIRAQVNLIYASTGARDADLTTPFAGQRAYIASNDVNEGPVERNSAGQWRKEWNMPWGRLAVSALPASFTFNSTLGYSPTFTFTAAQNRYYRVHVGGEFQNSTVTGVVDTVAMFTSAGAAVRNPGARFTAINASSQEYREFAFEYNHSSAGGTVIWKIGAQSTASATNQTFVPYTLLIEDVGPSGAPS